MTTYHLAQLIPSGDAFAIRVDDRDTVTGATGPLHYDDHHHSAHAYDYDDEWTEASAAAWNTDPRPYRILHDLTEGADA